MGIRSLALDSCGSSEWNGGGYWAEDKKPVKSQPARVNECGQSSVSSI